MNFRAPKTVAISVALVTILLMAVVPLAICKADKAKTCSAKPGEPCLPKAKKPKVCSGKDPKTCPPKSAKSGSIQDKPAKFEPATESTEAIARFEKMRYGAFIHFSMNTFMDPDEFGLSSCGAPEGSLPSAQRYNPTALDVDQWVATAKEAGMKYAVLTAKHYIGFCLWDSKYTDYDVGESGNKTDVVAEFVKACRKYGIAPGLYFPLGVDAAQQNKKISEDERYKLANNQITELLTNYGPIAVFWFDGMGPVSAERLQQAYDTVKSLQPDCLVVVNNGYSDGTRLRYWPVDITTGERTSPPQEGHNPWMEYNGKTYYIPMEICDTSAQGTSSKGWFWEPGEQLKEVKRELLRLYLKAADRGANLLLNVAIDREGKVPQATVERLLELGKAIKGKSGIAGSGGCGAAKAKTCSSKDPKACPPKGAKACSGKDPKSCPPKDTKKACSSKDGESCGPATKEKPVTKNIPAQFEPATERTDVIAQYEQMRYGMFIPFTIGVFLDKSSCGYAKDSVLPPPQIYNPTNLDVDQWIATAKKAGMQYAVLTVKYWGGFALWDSKYSDYDVAASGNKTDVVAEFVKACRKYGIAPCFIYTLGQDIALRQDKGLSDDEWYEHANNQIRELLTNYGPITAMWFDGMGAGDFPAERVQQAYDTVKSVQPDCLVVMHDPGRVGRWPTDVFQPGRNLPPPEGYNPKTERNGKTYYVPIEVIHPIVDDWFWKPNAKLVSQEYLLNFYRDATSRGANFALGTTIDRQGRVPAATVQRLLELGEAIKELDNGK